MAWESSNREVRIIRRRYQALRPGARGPDLFMGAERAELGGRSPTIAILDGDYELVAALVDELIAAARAA